MRNGDTVESDFHNFREGDHEDAALGPEVPTPTPSERNVYDAQSGDVT